MWADTGFSHATTKSARATKSKGGTNEHRAAHSMTASRVLESTVKASALLSVAALAAAALTIGAGGASSAASSPAWLDLINTYRAADGLTPVAENPAWTPGLSSHLRYMQLTPPSYLNGYDFHAENPASPYYTTAGALEARFSDLASGPLNPVDAVKRWLTAPFHALPILNPGLRQVALAWIPEKNGSPGTSLAGLDVGQGALPPSPPASPVVFTGDGMTTDLATFSGFEFPNSLAACPWKFAESGLPLIAQLPTAPSSALTASLTGPAGTVSGPSRELCVATELTPGYIDLAATHAVFLIPRLPLHAGHYTAHLSSTGSADIYWSFNVQPRPPLLVVRKYFDVTKRNSPVRRLDCTKPSATPFEIAIDLYGYESTNDDPGDYHIDAVVDGTLLQGADLPTVGFNSPTGGSIWFAGSRGDPAPVRGTRHAKLLVETASAPRRVLSKTPFVVPACPANSARARALKH